MTSKRIKFVTPQLFCGMPVKTEKHKHSLRVQRANSARLENMGYEVSMGKLFPNPSSSVRIICELVPVSPARSRAFVTAAQTVPSGFQLERVTMPTPITSDFVGELPGTSIPSANSSFNW